CDRCTGYQHILAITFTNNAGSEMKDRVVRQLHAFALFF
ncbi:MAG: UvrD-helicase domain-containing protein, partial [Neisseriaceae bacterium]|nr:UvrD-helicase domain-containing protein [Neisseriaceae bacterium]